jgi:tRNA U54 and U55 pseudouridine synthase Pus10
MWIFYKHLPRGTTIRDINKVTRKGYRSGLQLLNPFKNGLIKRSKIIRIKDLKTDSLEYHAIVQVDSPLSAESIIEKLDGKTVNGLFLKPHRYHRRFPSRDRRIHQPASIKVQERRQSDRRRDNLITRVLETS